MPDDNPTLEHAHTQSRLPLLNEKRHIHPLVEDALKSMRYAVEHEVRAGNDRIDFVARKGTEILVVEAKINFANPMQPIRQIHRYQSHFRARSIGVLAAPRTTLTRALESEYRRARIAILAVEVDYAGILQVDQLRDIRRLSTQANALVTMTMLRMRDPDMDERDAWLLYKTYAVLQYAEKMQYWVAAWLPDRFTLYRYVSNDLAQLGVNTVDIQGFWDTLIVPLYA